MKKIKFMKAVEALQNFQLDYYDEEGGFIECPHCGEPIYEEDYPELEFDRDEDEEIVLYCPICNFGF